MRVVLLAIALWFRSPTAPPAGSGPEETVREPSPARERPRPPPSSQPGTLCGALPWSQLQWDPRWGSLRLGGRLVIQPGQQLLLPAGTRVVASQDPSCKDSTGNVTRPSLLVAGGELLIRGTWRDPVVLSAFGNGTDLPWDGIQVVGTNGGAVDMEWFEVHRAKVGVNFSGSDGEMRHAVVQDCGIGIGAAAGAVPRILHCVVSRSRVADLVSDRSSVRVRSCLFLDGSGDGIRFSGTGLSRVETSLWWNHRGSDVVRGPRGLGGWRSDTVPDRFGNWRRDPLLRGTPSAVDSLERFQRHNAGGSWWKLRVLRDPPPGRGPWVPSVFSPLLGTGERRLVGRADIGLWDQLR